MNQPTFFLERLADKVLPLLYQEKQVTVVFPTQRLRSYFLRTLTRRKEDNKPIWAPKILTLNELIEQCSSLKRIDSIVQLLHLFNVYKAVKNADDLDFESFQVLGKIFLDDFNEIDSQLVNTSLFFQRLADEGSLDAAYSDFLSEEQRAVVLQYWNSIGKASDKNISKNTLLKWVEFEQTYHAFRDLLAGKGVGYFGLQVRDAIERVKESQASFTEDLLVFAGFNNLSKGTLAFINQVASKANSDFVWDYQTWYLDNASGSQAGYYLRQYLSSKWLNDQIKSTIKTTPVANSIPSRIEFHQVNKQSEGARLASSLLDGLLQENNEGPEIDERIAIVIPDPSYLQPLLAELPEVVRKLNLTLQFPINQSSTFNWLRSCLSIAIESEIEGGRIKLKSELIAKLLDLPYSPVKWILAPKLRSVSIGNGKSQEARKRIPFLYSDDLLGSSQTDERDVESEEGAAYNLLKAILNLPDLKHSQSAFVYANTLLAALYDCLNESNQEIPTWEAELLYALISKVRTLQHHFQDFGTVLDGRKALKVILEVLSEESISFTGEPLTGTQYLGFLETQGLQFDKVILLGFTEGILPPSFSSAGSFIPLSLRSAFGLDTPQERSARYAYLFYQLASNAKELYLIHANSTAKTEEVVRSRYYYQMQATHHWKINNFSHGHPGSVQSPGAIAVNQTTQSLAALKQRFGIENEKHKSFSPSSLDKLISCKLNFYFSKVLDIKTQAPQKTELGYDEIGNLFHQAIEAVYQPALEKQSVIDGQYIDAKLKILDELLLEKYTEIIANGETYRVVSDLRGINYIHFITAKDWITRTLNYDRGRKPFKIIGLELKINSPMEIPLANQPPITINFTGVIDRMDYEVATKTIRIIDYKTGKEETKFCNVEHLFDPIELAKGSKKAIRQLLLYAYFLPSQIKDIDYADLSTEIFKVKDLIGTKEKFSPRIIYNRQQLSGDELTDQARAVYQKVVGIIGNLFDADFKFAQTDNRKQCSYCDYKTICNR